MSYPTDNANGIPDAPETTVAEPVTPATEETTVVTPSEETATEDTVTPAADTLTGPPAEEVPAPENPADGQSED
jgi:hypothetical protein